MKSLTCREVGFDCSTVIIKLLSYCGQKWENEQFINIYNMVYQGWLPQLFCLDAIPAEIFLLRQLTQQKYFGNHPCSRQSHLRYKANSKLAATTTLCKLWNLFCPTFHKSVELDFLWWNYKYFYWGYTTINDSGNS